MASYPPPQGNPAQFDSALFTANEDFLTVEEANGRYLKFPFAQGTENLQQTNINGVLNANSTATFNDVVTIADGSNTTTIEQSTLTLDIENTVPTGTINITADNIVFTTPALPTTTAVLPLANDSSTKIPTTAWVQQAITAAGGASNVGWSLDIANSETETSYDVVVGGPLNLRTSTFNGTLNTNTLGFDTATANTSLTTPLINGVTGTLGLTSTNINLTGTTDVQGSLKVSDVTTGTKETTISQANNILTIANGENSGEVIVSVKDSLGAASNIIDAVSNTFTINSDNIILNGANPPTSNAIQPLLNDSSTKIPTTAWVQGAISSGTSGIPVLNATELSNYNNFSFLRPRTYAAYLGTERTATSQATLVSAIASSSAGDVVRVLADITITGSTLVLDKAIKLTAANRLIKITSTLSSTITVTTDGSLIQNMTIENTGTGSVETAVTYSNIAATTNGIDNCSIVTNEFGVQSNNAQIQITNCAFSFTGTPDSHRYISLNNLTGDTIIDNNTFSGNGGTQSSAPTRCVQFETGTFSGRFIFTNNNNIGLNDISQVLNTNGLVFSAGFQMFIMNNTFTIANGYVVLFGTNALTLVNSIYAFNNIEYLAASATGSKGIIAFDGSGTIPSSFPIYAQNNYVNTLRVDYTDMTQQRNRVVAYSSTMTAPTFLFYLQDIGNKLQFINGESIYGETIGSSKLSSTTLKTISAESATVNATTSLTTPTINGTSNSLTIASNTLSLSGTNPPTSSATQPAFTDSTTKIPTTAWVQGAIPQTSGWTYTSVGNKTSTTANVDVGANSVGNTRTLTVNGTSSVVGTLNLKDTTALTSQADISQVSVVTKYDNKEPTGAGRHEFTVYDGVSTQVLNTAMGIGQFSVYADTISFSGTNPPTSSSTQPASTDSSTKMPTTAWVQGAIPVKSGWTYTSVGDKTSTTANVEIGTTAPGGSRTLTVNGAVTTTELNTPILELPTGSLASGITVNNNLELGSGVNLEFGGTTGTIKGLALAEGHSNVDLDIKGKGGNVSIFTHNSSNVDTERITVLDTSGFVGISKTTPTVALDVGGAITSNNDITGNNLVATNSVISGNITSGTTGNVNMGISAVGSGSITVSTNSQTAMFINGGQQVVVGSVAPAANTRMTVECGYPLDPDAVALSLQAGSGVGHGAIIEHVAGSQIWKTGVESTGEYKIKNDVNLNYLDIDDQGMVNIYTPSTLPQNGIHLTSELTGTAVTDGVLLEIRPNGASTDMNLINEENQGRFIFQTTNNTGTTSTSMVIGHSSSPSYVSLPDTNSRLGITVNPPTCKLDLGASSTTNKLLSLGNTGAGNYDYYGFTTNTTSGTMVLNVPLATNYFSLGNGAGGSYTERFRINPFTTNPNILISSSGNSGQVGVGITGRGASGQFEIATGSDATSVIIGAGGTSTSMITNFRSRQVGINMDSSTGTTIGNIANFINIPFSQFSGTVSTAGTVVNGTGTTFTRLFVAGDTIRINSVNYTISVVNSDTQLTLASSAGNQTNVSYTSPQLTSRYTMLDQRGAMFIGDNAVPASSTPTNYTTDGLNIYCDDSSFPQYWGLKPSAGGTWRGGSTFVSTTGSNSNHFQLGSASSGSAIGFYTQNGSVGAYLRTDNVFVATVTPPSDRRIKKNIQDLDDNECLDILRRIEPKKYQYNDEQMSGSDYVYGFIAQQVRDVLPYATLINKFNTTDAMSNIISRVPHDNGTTTLILDKPYEVVPGNYVLIRDTNTFETADSVLIAEQSADPYSIIVDTTTLESLADVANHPNCVVVGKYVDDFLTLKKDALFTVAFSALQQIDKKVSQLETMNGVQNNNAPYMCGPSGRLAINNFNASINTPYNLASFTVKPPSAAHKVKLSVNFTCAESVNSAVATNCTITRSTGTVPLPSAVNLANGLYINQNGNDIGTPLSPINIKNVLASSSSSGISNAGHSYNITITDTPSTTDELCYTVRWATSFSSAYYFSYVNYNVEYIL